MGYPFRLCPSTGGQAWNKVTLREEINRCVSLAASDRFTVTELCADFHVSRKTGYKWLRRYEAEGLRGLRPRSRRPQGCAHRTAAEIERLILQNRRRHPSWGLKKLQDLLRGRHRSKRPRPAVSPNHESELRD